MSYSNKTSWDHETSPYVDLTQHLSTPHLIKYKSLFVINLSAVRVIQNSKATLYLELGVVIFQSLAEPNSSIKVYTEIQILKSL